MAKPLTFRFDTFGDRNTASSRLRAWRLGEFLAESGHRVLMNEGSSCDVYVCQKIRPFETLRHFREKGALAVYDFDDHLLLEGPEGHGVKDEVVAFINGADVVTVGSEYLRHEALRYHADVVVLDNPADINSADLMREKSPELRRIGWFGTAAGLTELGAVDTAETVRTVTRGGDIEFDLATIDQTLAGFDLLLLPVERNAWNLAKNANRMVKAVALGIPVLATSTEEHVRAAEQLGLDARFLIGEGEDWDAKIKGLRRDFMRVQATVARARGKALEIFSMQRAGEDWLRHVERALAAKKAGSSAPGRPGELADAARVTFSYRADAAPRAPQSDYFEIFDALWSKVQSAAQDWIVLQPDRVHLTPGFAGEVGEALRAALGRDVLLVRSHALGFPPDQWAAYDGDLRTALCHLRDPGVLVVRRKWLLDQPWRPAESLSYWTWTLVIQALSEGVLGVVDTPVTWREGAPDIVDVCSEYAAAGNGVSPDLPDPKQQWRRLSADIFAQVAERLPGPAGAAFALLASDPANLANGATPHRTAEQLERELQSVYASGSWRLTAPLRGIMRRVRGLSARHRTPGGP